MGGRGPSELTPTVDTVALTFLIHSDSIGYVRPLPDFFDRVSNGWFGVSVTLEPF